MFPRNLNVNLTLSSHRCGVLHGGYSCDLGLEIFFKEWRLWDITLYSALNVKRRLGRTSPPSSGLKKKPAWKQSSACHVLSRSFLTRLILRPRRWRRYVPPKRWLTFNGLHGIVSQKISTLQGGLIIKIKRNNFMGLKIEINAML
jgi:hypothetical protein